MNVILDLALSADGFIARPNGDSDWVSERTEELFKERVVAAGCLVVGSRTFEQYRGTIYPVAGTLNIVLSKSKQEPVDGVVYAESPEEVVRIAAERNCSGIVVAGGATVSKAFLERGLVDEIYFSVHPILLGEGMKPFGDLAMPDLVLLDSTDLGEGIHEDHYRVRK